MNARGVEKDEAEGVRWFAKAADADFPQAMTNYGIALYTGMGGIPIDTEKAVGFLKRAAAQGDARAKELLKRIGAE